MITQGRILVLVDRVELFRIPYLIIRSIIFYSKGYWEVYRRVQRMFY